MSTAPLQSSAQTSGTPWPPSSWVAFGLLTVLVSLAYANSLWNGFAYDDESIIVRNPSIQHVSAIPALFTSDYWGSTRPVEAGLEVVELLYRPFTMTTYAFNYAIGGLNPVGYHLTNVLLHLLVTWLVYRLAFKFGFEAEAAIIAASIFAVHPLHVEAVTNIVGRAELLMSAGVLGSLLLAAKGKWGLSMLAFAAGLFSKEQAMVLPFLLFLAMQCRCLNAKGEGLSQVSGARSLLFSRFIAYFLILAAYVVMRGHALGSLQLSRTGFLENPLVSADWLTRISTAVAVAGRYLWLSIWPSTLSADYSYNAVPLVHSLGDPRFWVSIAAWAALIMIGVWTRSGDRRGGFFIGLVILPFLPVSNLVFPIGTIMGERLFYLPSAGLALLVGWGWQRAIAGVGMRPASPRHSGPLHLAALTVLAIIITAMVVRTVIRNQDWADSETLHRRTIQLFPENARVHEYLGDLVMRKGDLTQAYNLYRTALRIYPEYPQVSFIFASNFGVLLRRLGKPKEAVEWLEKAAALNPRWSVLRVNLGNVYFDQGRLSEAASNYQQALALNPAPVEPLVNLSLVRSAQGQYAEALDLADGAIRRNAGFPLGYYARAQACEGLGLKEEAIKSYRQTLQLDPAFAEAEERLRALSVSAMS